jgi:hypothetical protein
VFRSVVLQSTAAATFSGSGGITAQQVSDAFTAGGSNNAAFTNTLTGTFINGANETAFAATNPQTIDAAFDATTYIGAVQNATDTWYAGWTCNSATASFGSTSSSCTTLPSLE